MVVTDFKIGRVVPLSTTSDVGDPLVRWRRGKVVDLETTIKRLRDRIAELSAEIHRRDHQGEWHTCVEESCRRDRAMVRGEDGW